MKRSVRNLSLVIAPVLAMSVQAAEPTRPSWLSWQANARLRHEHVEDGAFPRDADAATLRLRIGMAAEFAWNADAFVEAEGTAALGGSYNSSANGKAAFPAVADPEAAEINQAWLRWKPEGTSVTAGRQRLVFDNQRWIGNSGWRQNEQTFDAVAIDWKPAAPVDVRYAWLGRVHRVNTDEALDPLARERVLDTHAMSIGITQGRDRLAAYAYLHEDEDLATASTRTLGARWTMDRMQDGRGWGVTLEFARQQDHAGNPFDVDHSYWLVEPSLAWRGTTFRAGWEHLGGDGRHALQTPLAGLHAFNGWADKFAVTPAGGLEDRYVSAGGKLGTDGYARRMTWAVAYHDYRADTGGRYGREFDASLALPVAKSLNALVKFADYRSDGFARDTAKFWLQLEWSH